MNDNILFENNTDKEVWGFVEITYEIPPSGPPEEPWNHRAGIPTDTPEEPW